MSDVIVYGFPVSTYVNIVRLVLTHKGIAFAFHDLEPDMGTAKHLALHPFGRVPILDHGGLRIYETAAIAGYVDEAFDGPSLQPHDAAARARMHRWISAVNGYFYPYVTYHLTHERLIFPALGIAPDEKVVAHALPRIERALDVMECELGDGHPYIVGESLTLADFFLLPCLTGLSLTPEGQAMLLARPRIAKWRTNMEAIPAVSLVRASVAPHVGRPVEHARQWVESHRPRY